MNIEKGWIFYTADFSLGDLSKGEVRQTAKQLDLATAEKPDSQGICFIGDVPIEEFLSQFIDTEPGNIIDESGKVVGRHNGALFYTIGQRHGLGIGGGLPYYVTGKNMANNEVYVTSDIGSDALWSRELTLTSTHWITDKPAASEAYQARIRHRGELLECSVSAKDNKAMIKLTEPVRAAAPGQSVVIYRNKECLGGGVISTTKP